jgi:hypothetical protein
MDLNYVKEASDGIVILRKFHSTWKFRLHEDYEKDIGYNWDVELKGLMLKAFANKLGSFWSKAVCPSIENFQTIILHH